MKQHLNALIFAIAIVAGVAILASAYKYRYRDSENISVTGLGQKNFDSDLIVWIGSFSCIGSDLQTASSNLNRDRAAIKSYLLGKGISENEVVFSSAVIEKTYKTTTDAKGNETKEQTGFALTQFVSVESKEIDKVDGVSREVTELINQGIEFNSESPHYYYTKLAELKVEMIAAATRDAKNRAETIAANAGGKLGDLKSADMGVFQITGQNSSEDSYSSGGTYNTKARKKTASITMRLLYGVH